MDYEECPCNKNVPFEESFCLSCGVASESFVRGSLSDLRAELGKRVVFFERIEGCEGFENLSDEEKKDVVKGSHVLGYRAIDKQWYHFYKAKLFKNEQQDMCEKNRSDEIYDDDCFNRDLKKVHFLFNLIKEKDSDIDYANEENKVDKSIILEEFIGDKTYQYKKFKFHNYKYLCEKSGFSEIAVPVYTGLHKKRLMGVLLFGQFVFEDDIPDLEKWAISNNMKPNYVEEMIADAKKFDRYFKNFRHFLDSYPIINEEKPEYGNQKYGKILGEFIFRLHQRVTMRRREYLFELQGNLQNQINDLSSTVTLENLKNWDEKIKTLFKEISKRFAVKSILLFVPDLAQESIPYSEVYYAVKINNDIEEKTNINLDINKIKETEKYKFSIAEIVPHIENHSINEDVSSFYGYKDKQHFFGVLVEWEKEFYDDYSKEKDPNYPHDIFFVNLITLCRATIQTRVAFLKSSEIKSFSDTSIHDIAQKAYILGLHNESFSWDLRRATSVGVFSSEALKRDDSIGMRYTFQKQCIAYNNQIKNCRSSMDYLLRTLERGDLHELPKLESFNAVPKFLASFNQHFNNPYFKYHANRRIQVRYPYNIPVFMSADPVMIERALSNLVENAFKFAYEQTYIYLDYEVMDGFHKFSITNFCGGIDEKIANAIFEKGKRGDSRRTGQGIGLWQAKRYTEKHTGTLELKSGIIGKEETKEISKYNLSFLPILKKRSFSYRQQDEENILNLIKLMSETEEKLKIENAALYPFVGYDDEFCEFRKDDEKQPTFTSIKHMCKQPLYAVTFEMSIPFETLPKK
ncbi:MAG: HAMP domain-containing histidine kinase [Oscillospiraceae bacterium]|nr:HAMP domain-containing histidine kinase [Oscillospiraceae bacterium]